MVPKVKVTCTTTPLLSLNDTTIRHQVLQDIENRLEADSQTAEECPRLAPVASPTAILEEDADDNDDESPSKRRHSVEITGLELLHESSSFSVDSDEGTEDFSYDSYAQDSYEMKGQRTHFFKRTISARLPEIPAGGLGLSSSIHSTDQAMMAGAKQKDDMLPPPPPPMMEEMSTPRMNNKSPQDMTGRRSSLERRRSSLLRKLKDLDSDLKGADDSTSHCCDSDDDLISEEDELEFDSDDESSDCDEDEDYSYANDSFKLCFKKTNNIPAALMPPKDLERQISGDSSHSFSKQNLETMSMNSCGASRAA